LKNGKSTDAEQAKAVMD